MNATVRKRDFQKSAVYLWEQSLPGFKRDFDGPQMPIEWCTHLVFDVWRSYFPGEAPPVVKHKRGGGNATGWDEEIALPSWAWRRSIVLHETAHALIHKYQLKEYGGRFAYAAHGPEFARLLACLLTAWGEEDEEEIIRIGLTQRPTPVRFAAPDRIPHPVKEPERLVKAAAKPPVFTRRIVDTQLSLFLQTKGK